MHRLADAATDVLFGLIAVHNDLVTPATAAAALRARDGDAVVGQVLVAQGALTDRQRHLVDSLSSEYVERHGGDARAGLAAFVAAGSGRERLDRVGDAELTRDLESLVSTVVLGTAGDLHGMAVAAGDGPRFRTLRPHAKGGIGEVFVALDAELNREVALKRIQERRADDPGSRARFLLEAEVTGRLEHPGIVPVYALGRDAGGRPYYAMRFIRGESLKEAIAAFHEAAGRPEADPAARSLGLRQLLRRFVDACNAVEYAHGRGVLHRDLKPGNIMVGPYGETLVVDWGLARALAPATRGTGPGDLEQPICVSSDGGASDTIPGSVLGTPSYMSPEQAAGDLDRLGPRSDVYSLGATLACLLTGRSPFSEREPGEVLGAVRAGDFVPPRQVDRSIDPALEAVCLKAMALDPADRYSSPRALADDLDRWMADEEVSAWREPLGRRARRWARRHRTAMTAAAVALVAGMVGLMAVLVVQTRANVELSKANDATNQALAQSEAVRTFLVDTFRSPDPEQDGKEIKVADVLDRATQRLDQEFHGSEATRGALLDALGQTYWGLGLPQAAVKLLDRAGAVRGEALGPDHPDTLTTQDELANAYLDAGRMADAIALHEETLRLRTSRLGPDHLDTLTSRNNLGSAYIDAGRVVEAIAMLGETLKLRTSRLGPDHLHTLHTRNDLADAYKAAGRIAEAIALHERTLELKEAKLGPDHPGTLTSRNNLADAYRDAGRIAEAIELHEVTFKLRELKLGPDHPATLRSRNNLAAAYRDAGRTAEAIAMHEGTLRLTEAKLGPDHPLTFVTRGNLATAYRDAGRMAEAIELHEANLKRRELKLGPDHPGTLTTRTNLAIAYCDAGRIAGAIALHEGTLRLMETKLGPDHPRTLLVRTSLATADEQLDRWTEAEVLRRDALARRRKAVKPDSPLLAADLDGLGRNLLNQERWSEAETVLREGLAIREKATPDDWQRFAAMSLLGGALLSQGRHAEAEPLIVQGYQGMKAGESRIKVPERTLLREAAERAVRLYQEWNKPDQASAWKAKVAMPDLPADVFVPGHGR
jgi:eukaryotic-like serine/threonine-protein kinase